MAFIDAYQNNEQGKEIVFRTFCEFKSKCEFLDATTNRKFFIHKFMSSSKTIITALSFIQQQQEPGSAHHTYQFKTKGEIFPVLVAVSRGLRNVLAPNYLNTTQVCPRIFDTLATTAAETVIPWVTKFQLIVQEPAQDYSLPRNTTSCDGRDTIQYYETPFPTITKMVNEGQLRVLDFSSMIPRMYGGANEGDMLFGALSKMTKPIYTLRITRGFTSKLKINALVNALVQNPVLSQNLEILDVQHFESDNENPQDQFQPLLVNLTDENFPRLQQLIVITDTYMHREGVSGLKNFIKPRRFPRNLKKIYFKRCFLQESDSDEDDETKEERKSRQLNQLVRTNGAPLAKPEEDAVRKTPWWGDFPDSLISLSISQNIQQLPFQFGLKHLGQTLRNLKILEIDSVKFAGKPDEFKAEYLPRALVRCSISKVEAFAPDIFFGTLETSKLPPNLQILLLPGVGKQLTGRINIRELPRSLLHLNLRGNGFTGPLDFSDHALPPKLQTLQLSENQFECFTSATSSSKALDFSTLPRTLVSMKLDSNKLKGTVLPDDGSCFTTQNLPPRISIIDLKQNQLEGKLDLTDVPEFLSLLDLENNAFAGNATEIFLGSSGASRARIDDAEDSSSKQFNKTRKLINIRGNLKITGVVSRLKLPTGWMVMGEAVK